MVKWRNTCPDVLLTRIESSLEARCYLLRQSGPTGFYVKEHDSDKKYKVLLGSAHSCDCPIFIKEKDLCTHLLWILLRKFRVPKDSPVVYQLGLCERELNNVVYGKKEAINKTQQKTTSAGNDRDIHQRKKIETDDVCPICQEDLFKSKRVLTYCRFGCGNSVHITCMKIWADHQFKATGDDIIKCPLCRTEFGNHKVILQEYQKAKRRKKAMQKKVENICRKCGVQVGLDNSCRCISCSNFWLCSKCYETRYHSEHNFEYLKKPDGKWQLAMRYNTQLTLMPSISKLGMIRSGSINDEKESVFHSAGNVRRHTFTTSSKSLHSSSQPDLRWLSLGVSGVQLQEQMISNHRTSSNRISGLTRLPPIPNRDNSIVAEPTSSINNKRKGKLGKPRRNEKDEAEDISNVVKLF